MLAKIDRVRLLINRKGPQTSTQIADYLGELVQPTAGYLSAAFLKGMLSRELVNGRFVYDIKRPPQNRACNPTSFGCTMGLQYQTENHMDVGALARLADSYIAARNARLALAKEVDKLQETESELKASLMAALSSAGAMGVAGKAGRVTLVTKEEPTVRDWQAFYAYIVRNDAFDLLQKRLSAPAVRERWEAGATVEGVGTIPVTNLSITKL